MSHVTVSIAGHQYRMACENGQESHLTQVDGERFNGGTDDDIADKQSEDTRRQGCKADDHQRVRGSGPEIGAQQHARLQRHGMEIAADPIVQSEIVERKLCRQLHDGGQEQCEQR